MDTDSGAIEEIKNGAEHHAHGMCQPLKALGGRRVEAITVGGIGDGALKKLQAQGVRVSRATEGTVGQNVEFAKRNMLPEFDPGHLSCPKTDLS